MKVAEERGGLRISLDGLSPEGATEQLWVVREVQMDRTLVVGWLPRVNHKTLAALLKPVHQWCQSHYLGNSMRPIYDRDSNLKTEMRKTIRKGIRERTGEILTDASASDFSPADRDGSSG